jgi:hypothetical protein
MSAILHCAQAWSGTQLEQAAEKLNLAKSAPKGASENERRTPPLKRCPRSSLLAEITLIQKQQKSPGAAIVN